MSESLALQGVHHVSSITGNAAGNVAFYTRVLGMRLVKKTVNQDDVSAYHLFYGDEIGSPGTEFTFFDWPHSGENVAGSGEVFTVGLRVPNRESLEWWSRHLENEGAAPDEIGERDGRATLAFLDPEGQRLMLIEDAAPAAATPWRESAIPPQHAIRGLGPIRMAVRQLEPTADLLTRVLAFRQVRDYQDFDENRNAFRVTVFETGDGASGAGGELHVALRPDLPRAHGGIGGVHHVAFRIANDEEHSWWQNHLQRHGVRVTPVIDRYYFRALYFREPGGVLFEIATDGPGFATDEDAAHLGEKLSLPPFLESRRAQIEAGLAPL